MHCIFHSTQNAKQAGFLTLIYAAVGLYDTHNLNGFSPKVPMYKNSETVCIPSPKYCLYTNVSKFMKQ